MPSLAYSVKLFRPEPPIIVERHARYDAFLCHSSLDEPSAMRLAARLRAEGFKIWLDVEELPMGRNWQDALEEDVAAIHAAIVLVGQNEIFPWQSRTIRNYLTEFVDHDKPVIPVLLDGCHYEPKLPIFLKHLAWVDCRSSKDSQGFQRLVAGIATGRPTNQLAVRPNISAVDLYPIDNACPTQASGFPADTGDDPKPSIVQQALRQVCPVPHERLPVFRDPLKSGGFGPEMVVVPRGTFDMGDLAGDGFENERPIRTVSFAESFAIGRCPVTVAEYCLFAEANDRRKPNGFGWGGGSMPVVDVSWEDARAYASWLSSQTGNCYRLPSEAEWEYAARAGTDTAYWWGDEIGTNRANCADSGNEWSGKRATLVGSFQPNPWGLHDMAGNVWEWVQDRWHGNYQDAPNDGSAWEEGGCGARGLRGGSWINYSLSARSACRYDAHPSRRSSAIGFRLVRTAPFPKI